MLALVAADWVLGPPAPTARTAGWAASASARHLPAQAALLGHHALALPRFLLQFITLGLMAAADAHLPRVAEQADLRDPRDRAIQADGVTPSALRRGCQLAFAVNLVATRGASKTSRGDTEVVPSTSNSAPISMISGGSGSVRPLKALFSCASPGIYTPRVQGSAMQNKRLALPPANWSTPCALRAPLWPADHGAAGGAPSALGVVPAKIPSPSAAATGASPPDKSPAGGRA